LDLLKACSHRLAKQAVPQLAPNQSGFTWPGLRQTNILCCKLQPVLHCTLKVLFGSNSNLPKTFKHRNAIPVLKISDSVLILLTDDEIILSFDTFRLCFKIFVSL